MKRKLKTKNIAQRKKQKKIYDALRYRKKKLIKIIETIEKEFKNIYGNEERHKLAHYTRKDIEEMFKKAVYEKDKGKAKELMQLGEEVKGSEKKFKMSWAESLQKDLQENIYGTRPSKLKSATRKDYENFKLLMNGLDENQKLEFLNSSSYYGARRYQKPPAESETFNLQVKHDGASYIVQDLLKYYRDKGLIIPKDFINI